MEKGRKFDEAIRFVGNATAKRGLVESYKSIFIQDGFVYASDGRCTARCPVQDNHDENIAFDAKTLLNALSFGATTGEVVWLPRSIRINKEHNASVNVPKQSREYDFEQFRRDYTWRPLPDAFMDELETILPFVSENATHIYAMAVMICDEVMYATNNITLVAANSPLPMDKPFMFPLWGGQFLMAARNTTKEEFMDKPTQIAFDERSCAFLWDDGAMVVVNGIDAEFPASIPGLIGEIPNRMDDCTKITKEWRNGYNLFSQGIDGEVEIMPDRLVGKMGYGEIKVGAETILGDNQSVSFNAVFLTPVIHHANEINFTEYPETCPFVGDKIRGLIAGLVKR